METDDELCVDMSNEAMYGSRSTCCVLTPEEAAHAKALREHASLAAARAHTEFLAAHPGVKPADACAKREAAQAAARTKTP